MLTTERRSHEKERRQCGWIALWVCLGMAPSAPALNPALDVSQYAHTAWRSRDGFPKDSVQAIAQTSDGYLWLGAKGSGLTRYDGASAMAWQPPRPLPSDLVSHLVRGRDGTLWIGTMRVRRESGFLG